MIRLTNPATGHQITSDEASVEFWTAAGFRAEPEKKSPAKKASSKKDDDK